MVIAVWGVNLGIRRAGVCGLPQGETVDIHRVGILGVGMDVRVVPRARNEQIIRCCVDPSLAVVIRAVHARCVGVLDQTPDTTRSRRRGGDAHLAQGAGRQTRFAGDVFPCIAAVFGAVDRRASATGRNIPEFAMCFPCRCIQDTWIIDVDGEVDGAGVFVTIEDLGPGFATVRGLVDATFAVRAERMAEGCDPDDVRVGGVNAHFGDVTGIGEAHVLPGCTCVGGAVHAVPMRNVDADGGFAHAGPDHIGVGFRDGHCADRRRLEEAVRDIEPVLTSISGLPDTTCTGSEVKNIVIFGVSGDGDDTTTTERSDTTPLQ